MLQSDSGAMVLAHQGGPVFFLAEPVTPVWLHLCQALPSQRHEEISVFGRERASSVA